MSIFSSTIVNMSIETPDGVLDVTNATLRVPQIEVQGTSVTTSLSTLSNVGVGTASPDGRLHVYGPDAKTLLQSTSNTANVEIGGPSGAIVDLKGPFTDDYDLRIQSSSDGGNFATTGNVNHIRLASASGYTGFGTSAPQYKIDVQGVKGVDAVSNPSAYNAVFLYDDQESTTTFSGTVGGTGASRDTSSKYLELNSLADNVTGYVYWPIQMPNSWSAEFDYYVAGGDGGESVSFSFFNTSAPTTTGNHGGYRLAIAENYGGSPAAKAVLYYQGSEVAQSDIAGGIPTSSWNKVVVNYNRGSISLSFNGRSVFSYEATENADSYTGRYTGFIGKTNLRNNYHRVRNVKCTSGTNWVYATGSNATTLAYLSGNVGIGTDVTTERLEISGNVKATHFVGDGGLLSNIATTLNAIVNQGNTTSNTVQFTNADTGIVATGNIVVEEGGFFVGDGSKLVNIPTDFESIIVNGNTTSNVVFFANTNVAIQASGNIVVDSDSFFIGNGGLLSNIATTLEDISNQGNTTSNTIQFTNSDIGFVTTANVGIANSAPTNHLSVGSNLHVNDTGSNVLTVHGNVAANTLTLGDFQVVASYGLNHVTAENNQTGDTLVLTNATKGIDASSNIDLGGQLNFDSNVKIVGGGTGTYVNNLRIAPVASNIVTYDRSTGEVFDSGGLISNKLAIVSEQPPSALTGATTLVDGHGRYKVTTSLEAGSYQAWKCFNKSIDNADSGWSTGANGAYNGDGTYAGSNVIAGVSGEWVKIEFPYKTTLRHVSLSPNVYYSAMPENFSIVASNDDSNWTVIKSVTGQAWTSADYVNFVVNAGVAYKYYAIVAQLTNTNYAYIGEWRLFTETFTVDAGVVSTTAASGLDVGYTEHPVEPMRDFRTYVEGHGTYEASASSYDVNNPTEPWYAFDYGTTPPNRWSTSAANYDTSGIYAGNVTSTDIGGTRHLGEWLQIKLPYDITLSKIKLLTTTSLMSRAVTGGTILGSNDGTNWYVITTFSGLSHTQGEYATADINATTPYMYYRLVVKNVATGLAGNRPDIAEWRLFAEKPVTRMENVHISGELSSETLQTGYIKWPKVALRGEESEGYKVKYSSKFSGKEPYKAFNNSLEIGDDAWITDYNYTSGVANTGASDPQMNGIYGDWLELECPHKFNVSYIQFYNRDGTNYRSPKKGRFYGSNDGITFTQLLAWENLTIPNNDDPTKLNINATDAYKIYRIQIEEMVGPGDHAAIAELQLFEAATGVGAAPTSAKLQVAGSLGMAKGSELFAGDDVVMELPRHDRPLVKYPEVASGLRDGGYVASASSYYNINNYPPYEAFNGVYGTELDMWISSNYTYLSDGTADTSNCATFNGVYGEYLSLSMPKKIKLEKIRVHSRNNPGSSQSPENGRIYGSNDNSTWTQIGTYTGLNMLHNDYRTIIVNASEYYKDYTFQIEKMKQFGTATYTCIAELEYHGTEEGDTSVDVVHRSIPNKPSPQHLAVYWDAADSNSYSFADSSNVYDLSGSGVTGTITGTNGFDAEYNAWVFDGSGDYVQGTTSIGTGDVAHTWSLWAINLTPSSTQYGYLCGFGTAGSGTMSGFMLRNGDRLEFTMYGTYLVVDENFPSTDTTQWKHIVGVYRGGGWNATNNDVYIDGERVSLSGSGTTALSITGTDINIGSSPGGGQPFVGSIANARLYSKALNADQVRELYEYDAERFGHRQNLVALHKGNLGVGVAHPTSRFEVAGADGLQEYPPKAMTGYETYMEGHGVFRASESNTYTSISAPPWQVFDNSTTTFWHSNTVYNEDTGLYEGEQSLGGYAGEWISLTMPYKTKINTMLLRPRVAWPERTLYNGVLLGANSDEDWELVKQFSSVTFTDGEYKYLNIDSIKYYTKYALVVTRTNPSNARSDSVQFSIFRLFGTPAPSSLEDGHLTLGKALTLPRVSGHPAGAETPRAESLVVHYDTTVDSVVSGSTVVDISGNGLNGTLTNGAAYSSTDRALTFDGVNDRITGTLNNPSGAWVNSVAFWFKRNVASGVSGYDYIYKSGIIGGNGTSAMNIIITPTHELVWTIYNHTVFTPANTVVNDAWYHVVTVYRGGVVNLSNADIYVNGVKASNSTNGTAAATYPANATFVIGNNTTDNYNFNGSISNFKIWGGVALTAEEVAAEYALGRAGKSINLTDTALCLGGTVPRSQLDVRGSARFETMNVDGNVGIGTASPKAVAHVGKLSANSGTFNDIPQSNMGISATFPDSTRLWLSNRLSATGEDYWGMALGTKYTGDIYIQSVNKASNAIYDLLLQPNGGKVGIGTTNPAAGLVYRQPNLTYNASPGGGFRFIQQNTSNYWDIGVVSSTNTNFAIGYNGSSKGYFTSSGSNIQLNFTGQHRTFIKDIPFSQAGDLEGLIVSSDQNKYIKMSGGIEVGSNAITTNESLPVVSLSTIVNDKKCFGVISASEDPEERSDAFGSFVTPYEKELGDTRVYINSVGEGAMWVTDTNGSLESGDYITTSNVPGYGQRQDDDILHNYTVAKITMDCDFAPATQPIQQIVKELANVNYWVKTTYSNVSLEEYSNLAEENRTTEDETYYTKDVEQKFTYKPTVTVTADDAWDDVSIFPSDVTYAEWSNLEANVQNTYTLTYTQNDYESMRYEKTTVSNVTAEDAWDAVHIEPPGVTYAEYSNLEANVQNTYTLTYTKSVTMATTPAYYSNLAPEEQNTYTLVYTKTVTENVEAGTEGADAHVRTIYKKIEREDTKEERDDEEWVLDVRQELVNVLDEHGQLQWEDDPSGATEKAYKIRYLDASGAQTDEANAVHTAAFVGVTYHCG
jgi:hypothetical protein